MTESGQARSYRAYAQRDARAGSGDACNTNKDYVFEEAVGGFAITYLGDNEAHSSRYRWRNRLWWALLAASLMRERQIIGESTERIF
jgi:hypothetical protein